MSDIISLAMKNCRSKDGLLKRIDRVYGEIVDLEDGLVCLRELIKKNEASDLNFGIAVLLKGLGQIGFDARESLAGIMDDLKKLPEAAQA